MAKMESIFQAFGAAGSVSWAGLNVNTYFKTSLISSYTPASRCSSFILELLPLGTGFICIQYLSIQTRSSPKVGSIAFIHKYYIESFSENKKSMKAKAK